MATTAKTKPAKTAPEVFAECAGYYRERRLTAEAVLVDHRAWIRLEMQDCPGAGFPPAESTGQ
jgi:hypothetical protein